MQIHGSQPACQKRCLQTTTACLGAATATARHRRFESHAQALIQMHSPTRETADDIKTTSSNTNIQHSHHTCRDGLIVQCIGAQVTQQQLLQLLAAQLGLPQAHLFAAAAWSALHTATNSRDHNLQHCAV